MWLTPADMWGDEEHEAIIQPARPRGRQAQVGGARRVTVEFDPVSRRTVAEEVRARLAERIAPASSPPAQPAARPSAACASSSASPARRCARRIQGLVSLGVARAPRQPHATSPSTCPRPALRVTDRVRQSQAVRASCSRCAACSSCRSPSWRASGPPPRARDDPPQRAGVPPVGMPLNEFRVPRSPLPLGGGHACGNPLLAEMYGKVLDALFAVGRVRVAALARSQPDRVGQLIAAPIDEHQRDRQGDRRRRTCRRRRGLRRPPGRSKSA